MSNDAEPIYTCTFEDTNGATVYEIVVLDAEPAEAYVLVTPAGFVSAFSRILVILGFRTACEIAKEHTETGGVLFWKGTVDSWRESAKEIGVPILLVKGDNDV